MARRSRRETARRRTQAIIGSIVFLVVFGIATAGVYDFLHPDVPPIDKVSLCPAQGPKGHYVLLVDKTDPLNFTQKEAFAVTLRELIEKRIPEGYLLSVFVLGADITETAKPLVELCNPGTGQDKSELTANLTQLKRQYQQRFLDPLLAQSEALLASEPAMASPIFEMLQLVGINAFRKHDVKGERRLIMMSDMLHNTRYFSMYKGRVSFEIFSASDYGRKSQSELSDVEVEIHYLINRPDLQSRKSMEFWEGYFKKAGARIVAVRPLEG